MTSKVSDRASTEIEAPDVADQLDPRVQRRGDGFVHVFSLVVQIGRPPNTVTTTVVTDERP